MDESLTSGGAYYELSKGCPAFTQLSLTGGAIGSGPSIALGAALACPDRTVINIQARTRGRARVLCGFPSLHAGPIGLPPCFQRSPPGHCRPMGPSSTRPRPSGARAGRGPTSRPSFATTGPTPSSRWRQGGSASRTSRVRSRAGHLTRPVRLEHRWIPKLTPAQVLQPGS